MGQKINPISLRLYSPNRHFDNCWYSNYFYKNLLTRDVFLQNYLNNFLKLLKIPTGRYSVQHFQKNTQVYNFFCYSKSSREWKSRLFGLAKKKNFSESTRFVFKTKGEFKKRLKKSTKLQSFYTLLQLNTLHTIQKKITSFQNYQLWSRIKNKKKRMINSYFMFFPKVKEKMKTKDSFSFIFENLTNYSSVQLNQIEKRNKISATQNKKRISSPQELQENLAQLFTKNLSNSSLIFLQNLFIYKIIKSSVNLKTKSSRHLSYTYERVNLNFSSLHNSNQKIRNFTSYDLKYKNYLERSLSSVYNLEINVIPFKVKNEWQSASFFADDIVYFLEKRIPFRRLKTKILKQLAQIPQIRGVRITCSGRVGGKSKKAQRAKTECIKYGQTPLQVFSSKIDFSVKTAFTSFGSVGVKVWICYN